MTSWIRCRGGSSMKCPEFPASSTTFQESPPLPSSGDDDLGIVVSRVFISGSSTGLGLMTGELLVQQGHQVVLHARNAARAEDARLALPQAKAVAKRVNELDRFDAVIHNAAVGYRERHVLTTDGLPHVFAINTLATYILK